MIKINTLNKPSKAMSGKQITPEQALILRIVEQWGNVVNMPKMEQWLKDYTASQPPAVKGAKWWKASSWFPIGKRVIAKWFVPYLKREVVGYASSATGETITFDWGLSSVTWKSYHEELADVWWLDESGESPTAAGDGKEAIEFHDWVEDNAPAIDFREQKTHTTAQLYDIFKNRPQ